MTFYVDNEVEAKFDFDFEEIAREVAEAVLKEEECEYDVEISLTITDDEGIRAIDTRNDMPPTRLSGSSGHGSQ